jgi:hypothetical protein
MYKPEPGKVVLVDAIPRCDFCDKDGLYDFKTVDGPWAHGCYEHYRYLAMYPDLGTGKGQLWVTEDQVDATE